MLLAALLDAGLPRDYLERQLTALPPGGYRWDFERREQGGLLAGHLRIRLASGENRSHRPWAEIEAMLTAAPLEAAVRATALAVFRTLAAAEGRIHGRPPAEVHFHEVGAVDSIVDIVGVAAGLHYFGIDKLICSPLPLGRGWVNSAHGPLPLPAPATVELLKEVPVYGTELEMELVTPTGAAIVKTLARDFGPPPPMIIEQTGYGAGSKERADGRPNLLRLLVGREWQVAEAQEVEVIETQLDDWAAEGFAHLCQRLFALGALDVSLTPLLMKKGRPGQLLRVLADPHQAPQLRRCLLSETTAIGLRFRREQRQTLPREQGVVSTPWGEIMVKKVLAPDGERLHPEYESCRQAALRHQVSLLRIQTHVAGLPLAAFRPAPAAANPQES